MRGLEAVGTDFVADVTASRHQCGSCLILLDFVLNGYVLLIECALRCIIILIWTAVQFEGATAK